MAVRINNNSKNINKILINQKIALSETVENILADIVKAQIMPYKTGRLQDEATYIIKSQENENGLCVVSDTEYAGRLYFHPEYKYSDSKNKDASGYWFDAYINGDKKEWVKEIYAEKLRALLGKREG